MMIDLPHITIPSKVCEVCQGKSRRAKDVLELVHYDISGPIKPTSNGDRMWYITCID